MRYDYLIVGAGLFGAVFAHEMKEKGKRCLVVEKRNHIGGNIYTETVEGIEVHRYGAHIFHTSDRNAWEYVNQFAEFNNYINSPVAFYKGEVYNLPFNMNTFSKMWGVRTPQEAMDRLEEEREKTKTLQPKNLEEQAINLVGQEIYQKLVKGYTEKQWGRACTELPAFIIKRLPVRFTYDNNYFSDRWQGIPIGGYTKIIENLLAGIEVRMGVDYLKNRDVFAGNFNRLLFTGPIDAYYNYEYGALEYRSLRFETEILDMENYQGNAVVNYTEREIPYTRIIEHKHFEFGKQPVTVITREYPAAWNKEAEPYYTINDDKNMNLYKKYAARAEQEGNVIFGGRLGSYAYYDMDKVIAKSLEFVQNS